MYDQPYWQQLMNTCVHFNGTINDRCEAGIRYHDVCDRDRTLRDRYPCWQDSKCTLQCDRRQFMTETEAKAKDEEAMQEVRQFFEKLEQNICPHCGATIQVRQQVGPCVYAQPCGCRLYQGRV